MYNIIQYKNINTNAVDPLPQRCNGDAVAAARRGCRLLCIVFVCVILVSIYFPRTFCLPMNAETMLARDLYIIIKKKKCYFFLPLRRGR